LVTTHTFVRPGDPEIPPQTGGGKIKLEAAIVAPIPPPRSVWGIVLPAMLVVGIVGLIAVMYISGARQLAGLFPAEGVLADLGRQAPRAHGHRRGVEVRVGVGQAREKG